MLYALDMSVHSTHIMYGVECPCRGLHTLVMGLSAVTQIALTVTHDNLDEKK